MGYAFFVLMLMIAALMIPFSREAAEGAAEGLRLFAEGVLPSLFPFFVCTDHLVGSGVFRRAARGDKLMVFPLLAVVTAVCGTPSAALLCGELTESGCCSRREASLLCAALNQTGPMFIISTLSIGFLNSDALAPFFCAAHYIPSFASAVLLAFVFRKRGRAAVSADGSALASPLPLFIDSISRSVTRILRVGGIIVFFRVMHSVFTACGAAKLLSEDAAGLIAGLFEMTNGVHLLCTVGSAKALTLCAFLITFGGLCIFIQTKMLFPKLEAASYFSVKLALGVVSALLFALLFNSFAPAAEVFENMDPDRFSVVSDTAKSRAAALICFASASGLTLISSAILSRISRRI